MGVKLVKSEDVFSFHLDGNSSIDAILLSKIISNIAELTKMAAIYENPDSYLRMNVTAFKNGSFEIDFSTICEITENIISQGNDLIGFASTAIATVKGFLDVKKLLKGKKPKSVKETSDGRIIITSEDDHSINVTKSSGAVVNNVHIDNLVVNLAQNVSEHNSKGGFFFNTKDSSEHFNSADIEEMRKPLPTAQEEIVKNITTKADLLIKKAALIGKGAWSFIYNSKTIEAKIEDTDFLEQIHKGEFAIQSGDYITADLKITIPYDMNIGFDESATKYTICKVYGGIQNNKNLMTPFI